MDKKELMDMIKDDLTLSEANIETKMYTIPSLHSKYLGLYFNTKTKLNKLDKELSALYLKKYNIFKDNNELLDKKEIQFHIMADDEYAKLNYKVRCAADMVDVLDRTVKKVNNLSFDFKNIVGYLTFIQGVN